MALNKQPVSINFSQGLDTKTDPKQVQVGKFLQLKNTVFDIGGLLQKRNGFGALPSLPDNTSEFVTTFNGNLTAIGNKLQAYSSGTGTWVDKGSIQPLELETLPLIRSNTNQSQVDAVIASNGLICTVYTDQDPSNLSNPIYKYAIADSVTGQNIVIPTKIPVSTGAVSGAPRVFLLGNYFVIVVTNLISGTYHLQYIAISTANPSNVTTNVNISSVYAPSSTLSFDGVVANNNLYISWAGSDGSVKITFLDDALTLHNTVSFSGQAATIMSVSADTTGSTAVIYAAYFDSGAVDGNVFAVNQNLSIILAPTGWTGSAPIANVTSSAQNGSIDIFAEVINAYGYDGSIPTNYINTVNVTQAGGIGSSTTVIKSVGLASKSFIISGTEYFLTSYQSDFQPTYFLVDSHGNIIAKLAYSNGGGYLLTGLPGVSVKDNVASIGYLFKDLIEAVNKNTNVPARSQVDGIYSQLGINLASFTIGTSNISVSEIAESLHLTGGFLTMFDGYTPVELGFFVWPDNVESPSQATMGGSMEALKYFYQVTYEWSDNQGNVHRSAPSIPIQVDISGSMTSTNTITIDAPTLRLTYKTANPVKIVIYRWSGNQQTYYQTTSIETPILNDTTIDFVTFVDTNSDASILGNNIIYTNGGVIEDISPPACSDVTLFDDRLFLIDSEDGTLWFSKQVIPTTPVEMSDLFTIYIAPTIGASGSTGNAKCIFPMDDKLIIFKKDAIYYINGTGPDNAGGNNQYSQPIFITSTVGCENKRSIVLTPDGIMFQSDKGIWLLERNLQTTYIGAAVERYNSYAVVSAIAVPATNQVRFTLSGDVTLMFDYYYNQWGTFVGIPGISSALYQGLHTFINSFGQVYQETPNKFLDGSNPVQISLTTSWLNLAGLQGYERAYFFYLIGSYLSPHKLQVQVAFDYSPAPSQQSLIVPNNYGGTYGQASPYGSQNPYGGPPSLEQWKVFLQRQTCQSFQITINEIFDPFFGTIAGEGLTLSGLNFLVGIKKSYRPIRANTVG